MKLWQTSCVCCSEDRRTASVLALPPGVECLTVDREYVTSVHLSSLPLLRAYSNFVLLTSVFTVCECELRWRDREIWKPVLLNFCIGSIHGSGSMCFHDRCNIERSFLLLAFHFVIIPCEITETVLSRHASRVTNNWLTWRTTDDLVNFKKLRRDMKRFTRSHEN